MLNLLPFLTYAAGGTALVNPNSRRWIGSAVTDASGFLGGRISELTGLAGFGRDFGSNMNLKIDGGHAIDFNIRFPDLVSAAQLLSDGLSRLDFSGGLVRRAMLDIDATNSTLQRLESLRGRLTHGTWPETRVSSYFFNVEISSKSVSNSGTESAGGAAVRVGHDTACALSIVVNNEPILTKFDHQIWKSEPNQPPRPTRILRTIGPLRLRTGNSPNYVTCSVQSPENAPERLKHACVDIQLIRQTGSDSEALCEWIFDGESGESAFNATFYIDSPDWCPKPDSPASPRVNRLLTKIEEMRAQFQGDLQPVQEDNVLSLVQKRLLSPYLGRTQIARELIDEILKSASSELGTLDVRFPVTAVVEGVAGQGRISLRHAESTTDFVGSALLSAGDKFSCRIPVRTDGREQRIVATLIPDTIATRFSFSLFHGLEPFGMLAGARALSNTLPSADIVVSVADTLT